MEHFYNRAVWYEKLSILNGTLLQLTRAIHVWKESTPKIGQYNKRATSFENIK